MHEIVLRVHVACAMLSIGGFVLRGVWMLADSPLRRTRAARTLPHVVDTLLLASAGVLAMGLGQWPFTAPWLTAKATALLLYIGLGLIAFRLGPTRAMRATAFLAALAVVAYLVTVAVTRDPLPFA